jgi:hypothetical protein
MWEECNDPRELLRPTEKYLKQERFLWLAAEFVEQIRELGSFCPQIDQYWTTGFVAWVRGDGPIPTGMVTYSPDFDFFPYRVESTPVDWAREAMFQNMQQRQWCSLAVNAYIVVAAQSQTYERLITQQHKPKSKAKLAQFKAKEQARELEWKNAINLREKSVEEVFCNSFRDVAGNPFEPVEFEPLWRTDTVMALACGIHAEAAFDRMPILADAMEEAGCNYPTILHHCRTEQHHVRGCWVISELFEDRWE